MKTENTAKEARLTFFKELYENARRSSGGIFEELDRHMRQYRGSDEIDGSEERAVAVRNVTYEIIESQVSSEIPYPKVDSEFYSEMREENARNIERLCISTRDRLPFETMNDLDERYTYIYGGSVWFVEWDNEEKGVRVHCISPKSFIAQPGITEVSEMEYCFLNFTTTRGELTRKYGIADDESSLAECEYEYGGPTADGDAVTVTVCFYRGSDGEIGQFIFSGSLTLSDIPAYYKRKITVFKRCKKTESDCTCKAPRLELTDLHFETVPGEKCHGASVKAEKILVPYYTPKEFPIVIRKNTSRENSLFGQSDCEYIRPEQQAINKIESRILQKLLRAGVTPIIPEDATVSVSNAVFGQIIKMKPGESAAQYGKVDTTPDVSQDIAEADRLYDHTKRILGISDAFQGIDTSKVESGIAKQLRIKQATGRLESKKRMKEAAYAAINRLIFIHYLAFSDEVRELSYKDAYGTVHTSAFNRYDFIERDRDSGMCKYFDRYLFSVDRNEGADYDRTALWERNLENLRSGTLGDVRDPATLFRYWQAQQRVHYPYARENAEYFRAELEKREKDGTKSGTVTVKTEENKEERSISQ